MHVHIPCFAESVSDQWCHGCRFPVRCGTALPLCHRQHERLSKPTVDRNGEHAFLFETSPTVKWPKKRASHVGLVRWLQQSHHQHFEPNETNTPAHTPRCIEICKLEWHSGVSRPEKTHRSDRDQFRAREPTRVKTSSRPAFTTNFPELSRTASHFHFTSPHTW